jgi:hypothetical protein
VRRGADAERYGLQGMIIIIICNIMHVWVPRQSEDMFANQMLEEVFQRNIKSCCLITFPAKKQKVTSYNNNFE